MTSEETRFLKRVVVSDGVISRHPRSNLELRNETLRTGHASAVPCGRGCGQTLSTPQTKQLKRKRTDIESENQDGSSNTVKPGETVSTGATYSATQNPDAHPSPWASPPFPKVCALHDPAPESSIERYRM